MKTPNELDAMKYDRERITLGPLGLSMIFKSSLVHVSVTTPLGKKLKCNTFFIGSDSLSYLLLKLPTISKEMVEEFFQEGFTLTVKAISDQGEGSIIIFRSQITEILQRPAALMVLAMPKTMRLHQLRNEPRFEVAMNALVSKDDAHVNVELRDLSNSGCNFAIDSSDSTFEKQDIVQIKVMRKNSDEVVSVLGGDICNSFTKGGVTSYGVRFNEASSEEINTLLARLIFDGSKMCFPS
ncbi:PilZ domain-containing protein [Aliivibrio kagoshimensis]|uniref:PilZ domain-containing protein n=1 Tax=Aliivibrio kagoshimensis TaxID=2910230 RepID=UPI003D09A3A1